MQLIERKKVEQRSPTLQTVLMVERFIEDRSGELKKTQLWKKLPKKVMWQTFQIILDYLESIHKIVYDKEGHLVYTWNPELVARYKDKKDLKWNAK